MPKNYYLESYQKNSQKFMNFLNKEIPEDYETQKRKLEEYEMFSGYTGNTYSQREEYAKKKETLKVKACELRDNVKEYNKFMSGLSEKKISA